MKERTRATRALEIIHTDVCGPIDPDTWDGNKYFITFLDDYTHHTSVYLLKGKFEVFEKVRDYVEEVESKWNSKVSKLRCDNGTEYTNKKMKNYCRKKGIKLDYTVPHIPQQNGKAERLNRTLLDKARALIIDSGLKKEMWGEAVRIAAYLVNRSPTELLTVTSNQLWTGEKPNLSNCRVFGCKAYAKELGYLKKLDERSNQLIFIGYSPGGYRLWNASKRRVVIRRDVVFCENKKESSEGEKVNLIAEELDRSRRRRRKRSRRGRRKRSRRRSSGI